MTKLITETPDHPIPFLIDHLQTKQDSPGKLHRALSGSAALWAQSSPGENTPSLPRASQREGTDCTHESRMRLLSLQADNALET